MTAGVAVLYAWAILSVLGALILVVVGTLYVIAGRKYCLTQKKLLEVEEKHLKDKLNRIVSMDPMDLQNYIKYQFHRALEVEANARISHNDKDRKERLYFYAMIRVYEHFGTDTVEAMNFYYGKEYLDRICLFHYRFLDETRGLIDKLINGDTRAEDLDRLAGVNNGLEPNGVRSQTRA